MVANLVHPQGESTVPDPSRIEPLPTAPNDAKAFITRPQGAFAAVQRLWKKSLRRVHFSSLPPSPSKGSHTSPSHFRAPQNVNNLTVSSSAHSMCALPSDAWDNGRGDEYHIGPVRSNADDGLGTEHVGCTPIAASAKWLSFADQAPCIEVCTPSSLAVVRGVHCNESDTVEGARITGNLERFPSGAPIACILAKQFVCECSFEGSTCSPSSMLQNQYILTGDEIVSVCDTKHSRTAFSIVYYVFLNLSGLNLITALLVPISAASNLFSGEQWQIVLDIVMVK